MSSASVLKQTRAQEVSHTSDQKEDVTICMSDKANEIYWSPL